MPEKQDDHQHAGHSHGHSHGHPEGHRHPFQPDLEDSDYSYHQVMTEAVVELLLEKAVFTAGELRQTVESIDARSPALGARVVARAWVDPAFKERLLKDVITAAAELGIDAGGIPIRAVENTAGVHNVLVCTLCSCYPRMLIGLPPDWYKARAYRSRVVREPRAVLEEFGTKIPDDVEVRVHDSTADLRYIVLPARPADTEGLDEEALAALVTRDCMIGTAVPRAN
jgi:nitrile hydratase